MRVRPRFPGSSVANHMAEQRVALPSLLNQRMPLHLSFSSFTISPQTQHHSYINGLQEDLEPTAISAGDKTKPLNDRVFPHMSPNAQNYPRILQELHNYGLHQSQGQFQCALFPTNIQSSTKNASNVISKQGIPIKNSCQMTQHNIKCFLAIRM